MLPSARNVEMTTRPCSARPRSAASSSVVMAAVFPSPAPPFRRLHGESQDELMRFAFKTSPQNTTWADMLAIWREADDIELFESGWTFDHFYPIFSDSTGPCM